MAFGEYVYAYLQNGAPHELGCPSLRVAVDRACEHIESEDAMVFQIRVGRDVALSGMDIFELYPDWLQWREVGGTHPADERSSQ